MSIYYFDFPFLIIPCCAAILIVLEYSFFRQHDSMHLKDALESAVTEYNKSGAQVTVKTAISATIPSAKPPQSAKDDFCKKIINITLNHLMCKGLLSIQPELTLLMNLTSFKALRLSYVLVTGKYNTPVLPSTTQDQWTCAITTVYAVWKHLVVCTLST